MRADSGLQTVAVTVVTTLAVVGLLLGLAVVLRRRRDLGSPVDRATYDDPAHRLAGRTPPARRADPRGAARASRHLRALLGTPAIAMCDTRPAAGLGRRRATTTGRTPWRHAATSSRTGRTAVLGAARGGLRRPGLPDPLRRCVAPIVTEDRVVAALGAYGSRPRRPALVRATEEVARWVSGQVELAELDTERTRAMEAELRALRAQISPHFIYNSLAAIASFVRTDPERARELLLEFADFTRYALPPRRRVHHAGRRAAQRRALPGAGAGPLRRAARRCRCWSRRRCCRSPSRSWSSSRWWRTPSGTGWRARSGVGHITHHRRGPRVRGGDRVEDDGVGSDPEWSARRSSGECRQRLAWAWATWTPGCARSTATPTAWSSRPPRAPAPR